jgi:hypothetical protein
MKRIVALFLAVGFAVNLAAQTPHEFPWQVGRGANPTTVDGLPTALLGPAFQRNGATQNSSKINGPNDFPLEAYQSSWNPSTELWDPFSHYIYAYYLSGDVAEITFEAYGPPYEPVQRHTYDYDANHHVVNSRLYDWSGSAWLNRDSSHTTYDAWGNETEKITFTDFNNTWDTASIVRNTYTYHVSNQVLTSVRELWSVGNGWIPSLRVENHYDANNQLDTTMSSTWVTITTSQWKPYRRLVGIQYYDYARNLPSAGRIQTYYNGWNDAQRYTVTYGQYDSQVWLYDEFITLWAPLQRNRIHYLAPGDIDTSSVENIVSNHWAISAATARQFTYDGQHHPVQVIEQDYHNGNYENAFKWDYPSYFVANAPFQSATFAVKAYPNPATDRLNFDLQTLRPGPVHLVLYDLQGRKRMETEIQHADGSVALPISNVLENGTYCYRITTKAGVAAGKVEIER